jgi:hypothetical protein
VVIVKTREMIPARVLPGNPRSFVQPGRYAPMMLVGAALGIWVTAIPILKSETFGQYGLLATRGGLFLLVSTIIAIVAFVWAIATNYTLCAVLAIATVVLIERVTATVITDLPIYQWTYKHIGIVEYMIDHHSSPHVQVYGDWPTFFSAMAWFSTVTGLDPVTAAHWFAVLSTGLMCLMVGTLAVSAGFSMRVALIAAMLAALLNWTGQDYYSPQAIGLILALAILTLLLHSRKEPLSGYISVPIFAVFVASHQLTPVWFCLLTIGLAVFGQIRPRWLALIYAAVLAAYVIPRLARTGQFAAFSGFDPFKNSTVVAEQRGSDGREFTIHIERWLALSVWVLSAVCFVIVWRRYGAPWAFGITAFSSMLILGGQDYGGEAIIRVYLYSIAGCAVLIAIVLAWILEVENRRLKLLGCLATVLLLVGLGAAGLQGYYGGWSYITIERSQLDQSRDLPGASTGRFVIGNIAPPVGWPQGATAEHVSLKLQNPGYDSVLDDVQPALLHKEYARAGDVQNLEQALPKFGRARTLYVVFPKQLIAYGEYLGWFPPTFIPSLIERISQTPDWTKVISDENTVVFAYTPRKQ